MRKNFGAQTWLCPMPVLIISTYDNEGNPNAMNAAWGGVYDFNMVTISLSKHKTTDNFKTTKAFTIAFADVDHINACDYVGIVSGNDVPDKFNRAGFTATRSEYVNAPIINELPLSLECEVVSFENGTLIGKIVNVSCDSKYLDEKDLPSLDKISLISYDPIHHKYISLGDVAGDAFKAGKNIK